MSILKKIVLSIYSLSLLVCFTVTERSFAATSASKPQVLFFLKGVKTTSYKVMIYTANEKSVIASYSVDDFKTVWAGRIQEIEYSIEIIKLHCRKIGIK